MSKALNLEVFIQKARAIHGDKYDYSKVEYVNNKSKVIVTCPIHGDFEQTPACHLRGSICPKCSKEESKLGLKEFIDKSRAIHGDKYDYTKVKYVNNKTKVIIGCPIHGDFEQTPICHLRGNGCRRCGLKETKPTLEYFIEKARAIHGDKYDYTKVKYVNNKTKVIISCPIHGDFEQTPACHLRGEGCPQCSLIGRNPKPSKTTEDFIKQSKKIHGAKYDYSKVTYLNSETKVKINCPIHGDFEQTASSHLSGKGCPKCGIKTRSEKNTNTLQFFIEKSKQIHSDKYDYSKVKYISNKTKVVITCPVHGDFEQTPRKHLLGHGCPVCGHSVSYAENEIRDYLLEHTPYEVEFRNRSILSRHREIDIYIPTLKIGIEYNGMRWHNEDFSVDRLSSYKKLIECNKLGIKLINIFEYEYLTHKEMVLDKLLTLLHCVNKEKIGARKCTIKPIDKEIAHVFMNENHLQGSVRATIYLGGFYNEKLVAVMSLKKGQDNEWELNRFCTDRNYQVIGIAGKLFKYFTRNYDYSSVISFADRRWTLDVNDNLYVKLGFKLDSITKPDYHYTKNATDFIHKFNFRKQRLNKKFGLPLTMTEHEMSKELGFSRIYDCGLFKFVWKAT